MFELFWDLYQQRQINQLKTEVRNEASEIELTARRTARSEVQELGDRLDRAVLVMHAMWTLLAEHTSITEADLARRVNEIDAKDGTADGRVTRPPVKSRAPPYGPRTSASGASCPFFQLRWRAVCSLRGKAGRGARSDG